MDRFKHHLVAEMIVAATNPLRRSQGIPVVAWKEMSANEKLAVADAVLKMRDELGASMIPTHPEMTAEESIRYDIVYWMYHADIIQTRQDSIDAANRDKELGIVAGFQVPAIKMTEAIENAAPEVGTVIDEAAQTEVIPSDDTQKGTPIK
jgi:hypothetical protein